MMKSRIVVIFTALLSTLAIEAHAEARQAFDCSADFLDGDTEAERDRLRVQLATDGLIEELRTTHREHLAGIYRDNTPEHRIVVRLTSVDPVESQVFDDVCGETLVVNFITGVPYTQAELRQALTDNSAELAGLFPGLQGTHADERTGEVVLTSLPVEGDVMEHQKEAERLLGVPVRVQITEAQLRLGALPHQAGSE
ncbi:hypothetical protein KUG47_09615 [Falsochrobactrum sp. TDYN1]|uniref:Uncharacterized protein n=1 Tax=Falsochrobactrum tianjinense TaxID=2706015 RepID=A0A949PNU9_9HYPH|nr:hypothetical protein [Falsochrobactrum sp. TDYN1]MBV2143755.1 hypothetical protein [Falsochrobactrum sp. TDYN1]